MSKFNLSSLGKVGAASLGRIIFALGAISLYIWLFGISGTIEGVNGANIEKTASSAAETSAPADTLTESGSKSPAVHDKPSPSVTSYDTTLNVSNDPKPRLADYTASTTVYMDSSEIMEFVTVDASAAETAPPEDGIVAVDDTSDTSENTLTSAESEEMTEISEAETTAPVTTTTVTTTTAATTTPITTTTTTAATTAEDVELPTDTADITDVGADVTTDDAEELDASEETDTEETTADSGEYHSTGKLSVMNSGTGSIVEGTEVSIISRIVQNEIGSSFSDEAIKAQAIAAYTYVKYYNDNGSAPSVNLAAVASERVTKLVSAVAGQALYYNGSIIQAVYCASSAGYTSSSENVWGVSYPYLKSVECSFDKEYDPNYGYVSEFTASELRTTIADKTGIVLDGDPAEWFKINGHVDSVYVGGMTIGGQSSYKNSDGSTVNITGRVFREKILSFSIRSACFTIKYIEQKDSFEITTYGYGHGVGLSQNGANILATYYGYSADQILQHYYPGVTVA